MVKIVNCALAGLLASLPVHSFAAWELNMPVGVTELSRRIHALHMLIFWICVVIAIAVFGAMIYSIVKFRRSQGAVPASFDHSTRAEIIWTIIPIVILVAMAVPAAATLVRIEDTRNSDLTVKVTGYQWRWHYEYLDQKVAFFSTLARESNAARQLRSGVDPKTVTNYLLDVDHPLVVPVGKKVRVLLTAGDVIHAWWVPAFGMKKDAIPGFVNELWFRADQTGIYRGQCAELCGRDHGFMPVVVDVRSQEDYDSWLKEQQAGAPTAQAAGTAPATAE
ncbi:MAG TPA: cytochrome c oxidase subunit II [Steroidobacteraceae bacterium]|nr:cytochrome c oxidase subunit II [Steroidobacteraceae bacterium]